MWDTDCAVNQRNPILFGGKSLNCHLFFSNENIFIIEILFLSRKPYVLCRFPVRYIAR